MSSLFKPGIEGAQHGALPLETFLDGVKEAGAAYVQLSNYQLHRPGGKNWELRDPQEVKQLAGDRGLIVGGSVHCPVYMATGGLELFPGETAPFHHPAFSKWKKLRERGPKYLVEDYLPRVFDCYANAGTKVLAHFYGPIFDPDERALHGTNTGNLDARYPWPFFNEKALGRALERHGELVRPVLALADERDLVLAHEAHPRTAAWTPAEWLLAKNAVGEFSDVNRLNADPSHCWNGLTFAETFGSPEMRDDVVLAHFKDHKIVAGRPLLTWLPQWSDRGMQFCPLGEGCLDLRSFAELLIKIGAVDRFRDISGLGFFPAIGEAEAAYQDGWQTALHGIRYLAREICWYSQAGGSFEDGMGEVKS